MKICIVTVYNSYNYGSYLQAISLSRALGSYGEVVFLNTKARNFHKEAIKYILKAASKFKFSATMFEIKRYKKYIKENLNIRTISYRDLPEYSPDCVVVGSDEIWNISRIQFNRYPVFWGEGVAAPVKIAYAPSVNNASADQIRASGYAARNIPEFRAISVRDQHTKNIIREYTERDVHTVLDPSMLYEVNKNVATKEKLGDYIAVYYFGRTAGENYKSEVEAIIQTARVLGKKLVSVGMWQSWCDECVIPAGDNPFEYYRNADFVITNTFHGTIYSLLYEKSFISFGRNSVKVQDLLSTFNLSDRIPDEYSVDVMVRILNKDIDFEKIAEILEEKRKESFSFLDHNLFDNYEK